MDLWKGFWKEEYDYDPNGNITQKRNGWGEIDYQYNPANQLTQIGNRTYQYDKNGNLTKEVLGKSYIGYQYNFGFLLASQEIDEPYKYYRGWNYSQEIIFYHYDAIRSVEMLTDKSGRVEEKYEYDVWGKAYEGSFEGNTYGFTGQRYQSELGVYSFAFRDYNPRTMRWVTEDPVKDGVNWYSYCDNEPVNFIDLFGLCKQEGQQSKSTSPSIQAPGTGKSQTNTGATIGPGNPTATIGPGHAFEDYTTKLTVGFAEIDGNLYVQIASVRTEVTGIVSVKADEQNVVVNLSIGAGATSSFIQESGITVDVHVNATVSLKDEIGNVIESKDVFVGSTEAKTPGTEPEELFDVGVSKSFNFTVPDSTKGDLSIEVSVHGSFGNTDGGSIVCPRTFEDVVETVEVERP